MRERLQLDDDISETMALEHFRFEIIFYFSKNCNIFSSEETSTQVCGSLTK